MSTPPPVWPPQPGVPSPYGAPPPSSDTTNLILIFGIMSLIGFAFLGPVAWIMGNNALASGMIDPSLRGQVSAGRVCGIIGTIILALVIVGVILFFGIFAAALHSAPSHQSFSAPTPGQ